TPVSAVVAGRDAERRVQIDRTRWDRTTLRQRKSRGQVRSHVVEMDNQRVAVRCLESGDRGRIAAAMRVRVITCDPRAGCPLREPSIRLKRADEIRGGDLGSAERWGVVDVGS